LSGLFWKTFKRRPSIDRSFLESVSGNLSLVVESSGKRHAYSLFPFFWRTFKRRPSIDKDFLESVSDNLSLVVESRGKRHAYSLFPFFLRAAFF